MVHFVVRLAVHDGIIQCKIFLVVSDTGGCKMVKGNLGKVTE